MSQLREWVLDKKVILAIGPGGVGKTTSSIAVAIGAAKEGKRVGLLSIDPAKRLASALGIDLSHELNEVSFEKKYEIRGSLEAAMLDQKAVFDNLVKRHTKDPQTLEKIFANPLYQSASTKLAGPLEYMALAKLKEMVDSGMYDLVVIDTPPDNNALDFLGRPNMLSGFSESKVMSWLIKPFHLANKMGGRRLMSLGEKLMGGITKVTGVKALHSLAEFLVLMQNVIDGLTDSGEETVNILKQVSTGFLLVSSPTSAASRSAQNLARQIPSLGYRIEKVLFNKALPESVQTSLKKSENIDAKSKTLSLLVRRANLEKNTIQQLRTSPAFQDQIPEIHQIAEQNFDLHSQEGIVALSSLIMSSKSS